MTYQNSHESSLPLISDLQFSLYAVQYST
uniref:Uncharacterized protein n=1 Tax=Arundo donax TaxID=35708 RepID=A0A0A8XZI1_ARUDO